MYVVPLHVLKHRPFEFLLAYDGVLLAPEMEIGGTLIAINEPHVWL